jgi:hypothetical protein
MLGAIAAAVVVASAIWVYWDATANKIGKIPGAGGMFNLSAGAWSVVTMFLWIVAFPAYLIKRGSLLARAKTEPVEVKRRWMKLSILCIVGALSILGQLGERPKPQASAPARPVAVAPQVNAPKPPPVVAVPSTEAAKPSPVAFQLPNDPLAADRALKATLARVSELEKELADLQRQVAMKNAEIAALEKKAKAAP